MVISISVLNSVAAAFLSECHRFTPLGEWVKHVYNCLFQGKNLMGTSQGSSSLYDMAARKAVDSWESGLAQKGVVPNNADDFLKNVGAKEGGEFEVTKRAVKKFATTLDKFQGRPELEIKDEMLEALKSPFLTRRLQAVAMTPKLPVADEYKSIVFEEAIKNSCSEVAEMAIEKMASSSLSGDKKVSVFYETFGEGTDSVKLLALNKILHTFPLKDETSPVSACEILYYAARYGSQIILERIGQLMPDYAAMDLGAEKDLFVYFLNRTVGKNMYFI